VAILVASNRVDGKRSKRRKRRREPNLQRLQTRADAAPSHLEARLVHLLAATAGQVEKRTLREDEAERAALDEEEGAGFSHPHPLLLLLATKAGQKQRSKGEGRRKPPPGAAHTCRSSNTPATSKTAGHVQHTLPTPPWPVRGAGHPTGTAAKRKQAGHRLFEEETVATIATPGSDQRSPSAATTNPRG
jgi:hypothetical protein